MNEEENKTKYISLKEAAKMSGYTPDYLSSLIRKGKLGGKRVGRDWFTTEQALKAYISSKEFVPVKGIPSPIASIFLFPLRQKLNLKLTLVILLVLVVIGFILFLLNPSVFEKTEQGEFDARVELQTKKVFIGEEGAETLKEYQEFNVTSYSSDAGGEIEISVEPKE